MELYIQFLFCVTLSVMPITSFSVILYSPAVQNTLPVGGDSRKQIYMIFVVALIGSFIFTIYSAGLFLKYKSREIGVFLALGTQKSRLSKALLAKTAQLLSCCIVVGLVLGGGGVLCYLAVVSNGLIEYRADGVSIPTNGFLYWFDIWNNCYDHNNHINSTLYEKNKCDGYII